MYQDLFIIIGLLHVSVLSGTLFGLVDLAVASKLVATAATDPALQLV